MYEIACIRMPIARIVVIVVDFSADRCFVWSILNSDVIVNEDRRSTTSIKSQKWYHR